MLKISIAALVILAGAGQVAAAEDKYRAIFHVLTTKGTFDENVIETTAGGVSRVECDMRKDAWWAEHGPMFEAIVADALAKGQQAGAKVTCERMD